MFNVLYLLIFVLLSGLFFYLYGVIVRKNSKNLQHSHFWFIFAAELLKYKMNGDQTERLSQAGECRNETECGILDSASKVAQGVLEEIKALAGTTTCKSVQLVRLKNWAQENGFWVADVNLLGEYFDRGSENETYLSFDSTKIIKLNDFRYADDNLTSFFDRIKAHNYYFDACQYRMIGFAENRDGKICAILEQPYIDDARLATQQEIHAEFLRLGFTAEDGGAYYTNGHHDIFDAVDGNVLVGSDNHLYFIDTIIYPTGTGGLETYNSLSPRASR